MFGGLPGLDPLFGNGAAFLDSEGFVTRLYDMAMMGQAVQQSRCQLGINGHAAPFRERQIGGDDGFCPCPSPRPTPGSARHP